MQRTNRWLACQVLCLGALMLLSALQVPAEIAAPGAEWEQSKRLLWTPSLSTPFVQDWLVCGEFALQPDDATTLPAQEARLRTDYLAAYGGEATYRPVAGAKVKRADGTEAVWKAVKLTGDRIDFLKEIKEYPANHLAVYAYTTIHRAQAGKAYISVGSDDSVRVWVNGKLVHEHILNRAAQPDDDLVPVDFQAGDNAVMVKIEQNTGGWLVCMRVLEAGQALQVEKLREKATTTLSPTASSAPGQLVVVTDTSVNISREMLQTVDVRVAAAGGKVVGTKSVPRGERAVFDTTGWADGMYDIVCRLTRANGLLVTGHALWFKGDALAAAKQLVASAPQRDAREPNDMIHVMLADMVQDRLGKDFAKKDQLPAVYPALLEYEELQQAKAGGPGPVHAYGYLRMAYRDEIDDSPQFCRVFLPANYDPAKTYPLLVYLHGYYGTNPPYYLWSETDLRFDNLADNYGAILIRPHGRNNTSYLGLGDQDVLRSIAMAKARFKIDENRVYLSGESMGGNGTWNVGTRHPELFAAIAPIFGGSDPYIYSTKEERAKMTAKELFRAERESTFAQMESLRTTPVFVNHGDSDEAVNVDNSRYAVRMLQRWGYDVKYWEHPGKGHVGHVYFGCDDAMVTWLLAQTRVENPRQVRVRSGELKSAAAQWVRIEQREQEYAFMQADAEVVGLNTIRLDTDNVLAVTLSPKAPLIDPGQPLRVLWNGRNLPDLKLTDGHVTLYAPGYTPQAGEKTPKVAGPLGDIFNTPFAIVVGTTSTDPLMRAVCDRFAQRQIAWWQQWQQVPPRVFKDTEITEADMERYSLILIGGPQENAVAKAMSAQIGLRLAPDAIILPANTGVVAGLDIPLDAAGLPGKVIKAQNAGVEMITRHPLNPERYVVVIAANSPVGMSYLSPVEFWYDVDVRIVDGRAGPDLFLATFDRNWRINEAFTEPADPKAHARALQQSPLKYATAAVPGKRLYLNELLEAKTEGEYDYISRGVTAQGNAVTLQGKRYANSISIGAWAGGALEYDLTGGNWTRLRGLFGLDASKSTATEDAKKALTATLIITGDGKELYRSKTLDARAKASKLDIDVTGVKVLRMEVKLAGYAPDIAINLADVRVER